MYPASVQTAHEDCSFDNAANEASFNLDELFFSHTDASGIIRSGNSVFQRVSGYSYAELIGKPHKLVRHPDTPRAVFWLLWQAIRQGKPIGAYVKNKSKDGKYYWVFAIVTAVEGGFLSVRLRPTTAVLDKIKQTYTSFSTRERKEALPPAASAQELLGIIKDLGFTSYENFMALALGKELMERDEKLGRNSTSELLVFENLVKAALSLFRNAATIAKACKTNENVPLNFTVLASKLGQEGATINVISANYRMLSSRMKAVLEKFMAAASEVASTIDNGYFLFCVSKIQAEMLALFSGETSDDSKAREHEMKLLEAQRSDFDRHSWRGLREIDKKIATFASACIEMSKLVTGLEVTRIMGKMEASAQTAAKIRLDELLADLESFQDKVAKALKAVETSNQLMKVETARLLKSAEKLLQTPTNVAA